MSQSYTELRAERRKTLDALQLSRRETDRLEDQKIEIERQIGIAQIVERALERHEERLAEQIEKIETSHARPVADSPQA